MWEDQLDAFCELLESSENTLALTGAGISAESGIPTFRGLEGLWAKYDFMEYGHALAR